MRNKKSRTNYPNFIGVRLSDFELDRLDQCANLLGISRSEYIRKLLIEKEIKNHIEIVADIDDLKKTCWRIWKNRFQFEPDSKIF